MTALTPTEAMSMAIQEAKKGAGFVSPNPLVGCVIVARDGQLLAKGYHARVGDAHAEVHALNAIKDKNLLKDAHLYVTLEPCAHEGRTPSCAKALAALPIAAVTYGLRDPNPLVAGRGAEILRTAGKAVDVYSGELVGELEELAEIFLLNMREQRPFVALKVASSLDGKVALNDGSSQWITSDESREHVQYLRGCYDAVLTGVGTFLRDNPRLNSRHPGFAEKRARVVLLDPVGKSYSHLASSQLMSVREPADLWVVTGPGIGAPPIGNHIQVTDLDRDFDLDDLLDQLFQADIKSVFIESGPRTASSFLRAKQVDRLYLFMAPKLLGDGMSWTSELRLSSLNEGIRLKDMRIENSGEDLLLTGKMVR